MQLQESQPGESISFRKKVRVQLAIHELTHAELARRLSVPASTLSAWLRGVCPAPADLPSRIDIALSHHDASASPFCPACDELLGGVGE